MHPWNVWGSRGLGPPAVATLERTRLDGRPSVYDHFLGRTGLIIGLYGVVFHGEDARDVH